MRTLTVGQRAVVHGFDWSQWQTPRDLGRAIGEGHAFAVFKASEGNGFRDPAYRTHVGAADQAGLCHGAYHFARPDWTGGNPYQDGAAEARFQMSVMADSECFIVLDLESTTLDAYRTTDYVRGWLDAVIASGRFPRRRQRIIYVGKWFTWAHTVTVGRDAVLWIPSYTAGYLPNVSPDQIGLPAWSSDLWPEGWDLWQYSSSGTVAGIHPSDVNVATLEWWQDVSGQAPAATQPFPAQHDGGNPAMWVFWFPFSPDGSARAAYRLVDVPKTKDAPRGLAWRWITDPTELSDLAFTGRVNAAVNVQLATTGSEAWDRLSERYPVEAGGPVPARPANPAAWASAA